MSERNATRYDIAIGACLVLWTSNCPAASSRKYSDGLYQVYNSTAAPSRYKEQAWRRLRILDPSTRLARPQRDATVARSTSSVSGMIYKNRGGSLRRRDSAALSVPPGAVAGDGLLVLSEQTMPSDLERSVMARKLGAMGLAAVSNGVEVGPGGPAFRVPATLTVPYDPLRAQAQNVEEQALQLYRWNRDKEQWEWLPSSVNRQDHTVSAQITRVSFYTVAGRLPPASP